MVKNDAFSNHVCLSLLFGFDCAVRLDFLICEVKTIGNDGRILRETAKVSFRSQHS